MQRLAPLIRHKKSTVHIYGDPQARLRGTGSMSFDEEATDNNASVVDQIRVGLIESIESEKKSHVEDFKANVPQPDTSWCPGYCDIDRNQVQEYLKKMYDWLLKYKDDLPKTLENWNYSMMNNAPALRIMVSAPVSAEQQEQIKKEQEQQEKEFKEKSKQNRLRFIVLPSVGITLGILVYFYMKSRK